MGQDEYHVYQEHMKEVLKETGYTVLRVMSAGSSLSGVGLDDCNPRR